MSSDQDGVLAVRHRLHIGYRALSHVAIALGPATTARRRRRSVALAAVGLLGDVVTGLALRDHTSDYRWRRLLYDVTDAFLHAGQVDRSPVATRGAVLLGIPLAVESAYRAVPRHPDDEWDWFALLPVFATTTAAAARRRLSRANLGLGQVGWTAAGAALGAALGLRQRAERDRRGAMAYEELQPRVLEERFNGSHDFAFGGAGPQVHNLKKTLYILESAGSTEAAGRLLLTLEHELRLAEHARNHGVYLGDLFPGADFDPITAWSIRLTRDQAEKVKSTTGGPTRPGYERSVTVAVLGDEAEARRAGGRVELSVNGEPLVLERETRKRPRLLDPAPVGVLAGAFWKLANMQPDMGGVPFVPIVPFVALDILQFGAFRYAPRLVSRPQLVVGVSAFSAAGYLIQAQRYATQLTNSAGEQVFAGHAGPMGAALIAGYYWTSLSTGAKVAVTSSAVAATIASLMLMRPDDRVRLFLRDSLMWWVLSFVGTAGLHERLASEGHNFVADVERQFAPLLDAAYLEGWREEGKVVLQRLELAERALEEIRDTLDPSVAGSIRIDLQEAYLCLMRAPSYYAR